MENKAKSTILLSLALTLSSIESENSMREFQSRGKSKDTPVTSTLKRSERSKRKGKNKSSKMSRKQNRKK